MNYLGPPYQKKLDNILVRL